MKLVKEVMFSLILVILLFLLGILASKYYYQPYWEAMGDRLARDYYSVVDYYGNEFYEFLEKVKEGEIKDERELIKFRKNAHNNGLKKQNVYQEYDKIVTRDYNRLIRPHKEADIPSNRLVEFEIFVLYQMGIYFDEGRVKVKKGEETLNNCLHVAEDIKDIIYEYNPSLKEGDYEKEDIIKGGHDFWKENEWKKVLTKMNNKARLQ